MSNIIAVELSGGLGNQLFQYAAGFALSRRHDAQLVLDTSLFLRRSEPRRVALGALSLEGLISAGAVQFSRDGNKAFFPVDGLSGAKRVVELSVVREAGFNYDQRFADLQSNVLLRGYWQSYRYFEHLCDDLRNAININAEVIEGRNRGLLDEIKGGLSVAVHVRRGDYLVEPYRSVHGACSLGYYRAAMNQFRKQVPRCTFYIFSDDAAWCQAALADHDVIVVAHNDSSQAHMDLMLMAACQHRILSNSSLSWWAAYLGERQGSEVVAPTPWFRNRSETPDLLRPQWVLKSRATGEPTIVLDQQVARTRVSVVIPARDRPAMLDEAIRSVMCQTKAVCEIIIALSDPSEECAAFAYDLARQHGLKVVAIPEANVSKARNAGIRAATGDWIAFLDDDDIWLPEKLQRQLRAAFLLNVGVVSCDFVLFNPSGDISGTGLKAIPAGLSLAEAMVLGNYVSGGSAAIVRADILRLVGGYDEQLRTAEDHDLWRRVAWQNEIVVLSDRLVRIRRHEHQLGSNEPLMREGRRRLFAKMCSDTPPELRHMLFPVGLFYWRKGWGVGVSDFVKIVPDFLANRTASRRVTRPMARLAVNQLLERFRTTQVTS